MFAKSHTHILYFTKNEKDFTFNPDAVRVWPAPGRRLMAMSVPIPRENFRMTSGFFARRKRRRNFSRPGSDTWYVSRVCGTFKEREGWHGCQMPLGVLDRVIRASSNPGDMVVDPFNGSGTTVLSAALLGRQFIGIDQSEQYVEHARKRLEHALKQANGKAANPNELFAPDRASRVRTETDAFGRPRVERQYRRRAEKAQSAEPTLI